VVVAIGYRLASQSCEGWVDVIAPVPVVSIQTLQAMEIEALNRARCFSRRPDTQGCSGSAVPNATASPMWIAHCWSRS
jgi:hypothetical protein